MTTALSVRLSGLETQVQLDKPSLFFTTLPSIWEEPSSEGDAIGKIRRNRCRVLVVDDSDLFRNSLVFNLRSLYGASVEEAQGGVGALKILEDGDFHLILLDVAMPDKNGVDVCQELLARGIEARIVLMSAFYDTENLEKAKAMNVTLLPKPLDDGALEGILLGCTGDRDS